MSRAIVISENGGPEVLQLQSREVGMPGPGEIRLRQEAIGINFIDVYHRTGLYKQQMPFVPGIEGAGIIEEVGEGVSDLKPGDRVGYAGPIGAYADVRLLPAEKAVRLPQGVDSDAAAALMSKAGTAHYLLFETWPLKSSDTILVHAAAGGVGSLLVQWASAISATVIATAGSAEKREAAKQHGAKFVFDSRADDWAKAVREATGGRGVDVVYDGVGKATFEGSLDCLRPRGLMVSYGNASGPVSVPSLGILATKGSLYVTRPTTAHYYGQTEDYRRTMAAVFGAYLSGKIKSSINQRFPLDEVQAAHCALEGRTTTGATLLIP